MGCSVPERVKICDTLYHSNLSMTVMVIATLATSFGHLDRLIELRSFLWGFLKREACVDKANTMQRLKDAIREAIANITSETPETRSEKCRLKGLHFVQRLETNIFLILYSVHNFQILIGDLYLKDCCVSFCVEVTVSW
jgi:hypothetical protein